jgi:predicted nucleic-acid-binding Zn-ribbon protein
MKKLISLEEHENDSKYYIQHNFNEPLLNGIACPKCGEELYDNKPAEILTSSPPKKKVLNVIMRNVTIMDIEKLNK